MARAVALLSGGLDSTLAIRLIQEQGIEVEALHFANGFGCGGRDPSAKLPAQRAAERLGVPLRIINNADSLWEIVKRPKHGYGSNMNPCIDCRIHALRLAAAFLKQAGADFLVTGEVVGQRPMSQHTQTIQLIEREAGVEGLVVRPLSAQLLPPSNAEKQGLVDRSKLLDIHGRSRQRQMELAREFGITDYPSPAGGCLLTDPGFSARLRELLQHHPQADRNDVELLKFGRHFRLDERTKAIVGRDESENPRLTELARANDLLLELVDVRGPTTLLRGETTKENVRTAAALTGRFSKARTQMAANVAVCAPNSTEAAIVTVEPLEEALARQMAIPSADRSKVHRRR